MTHFCVAWCMHACYDSTMRSMTRSCVVDPPLSAGMWHLCVTWLMHVRCDSFLCDATHSCVIQLGEKRLLSVCNMTHLYVTWLIRTCRDSFLCDMDARHMMLPSCCSYVHRCCSALYSAFRWHLLEDEKGEERKGYLQKVLFLDQLRREIAVNTYMYICIIMYMNNDMHVCMYVCICICMCVYIHVHAHIHIHVHTYTPSAVVH